MTEHVRGRREQLRIRPLPSSAVVHDRSTITLGAMLALTAFLVVTSVQTGRAERAKQAPRRAQLIDLIEAEQQDVTDLDARVETLRVDVAAAQERLAERNDLEQRVVDQLGRLGATAGTVALRGPGLRVELAPSDREPETEADATAYGIYDGDVQLVVNALLAAGAEAVSINGSRLVATTPIRAAGDTIVVNFRPLSPPYEISAIGASRERFEASDIARRFQRWTSLFGLGFEVRQTTVEVPAFTGRVRISQATSEGQV